MEKNAFQNVDGVNYPVSDSAQAGDKERHLKLIKDLELRDDDVICVGFPRTGNHWAYEVINMIMRQEVKFVEKSFYTCVLDVMGDSINEILEQTPSPRYLTTHHRAQTLPTQALEKNIPIIYLLRNPKDAVSSHYVLMSNVRHESAQFKGTWDEFFELHMAGKYFFGTFFDHILDMDKFMKDHPQQRVFIDSFEQMKKDPVGMIKELCKFLGKPDTLAEQIAAATEFSKMKKELKETKLKAEEKVFLVEGSDSLLRKGNIGGWKNRFTVAQSERFDKACHEKLAGCKLADYVKDYL